MFPCLMQNPRHSLHYVIFWHTDSHQRFAGNIGATHPRYT